MLTGLLAAGGIALWLRNVPLPAKVSFAARVAPLLDARVGPTLATALLAIKPIQGQLIAGIGMSGLATLKA